MAYKVLYRKYRPNTFKKIIGLQKSLYLWGFSALWPIGQLFFILLLEKIKIYKNNLDGGKKVVFWSKAS